jgi:alginate O-acetyltransferase complex protein AlgI
MVFASPIFLGYFLPLVLGGYYLLPATGPARNRWLLGVSYVFYGWWDPRLVPALFVLTLATFGLARWLGREDLPESRRRLGLAVGVGLALAVLFVGKYLGFAFDNYDRLAATLGWAPAPAARWALPLGISFFTFHAISTLVDVHRRDAKPMASLVDFACYLAFFPQLIAGPILRFGVIAPAYAGRKHSWARVAAGFALFSLGLAKKVLIANTLAPVADLAFGARELDAPTAWFGLVAYGLQLYYDFSGYSDMATGLARLFGFEFPRNFNAPYLAESITDFWRRWHISLGGFLRDYLYIPLGGNRRGPLRTGLNLLIVMVLGGLWHGAAWTFVAWGLWHGALLVTERLLGGRAWYEDLPRFLRVLATFILVLLGWVLFRAGSLAAAGDYFAALGRFDGTAGAPVRLLGAELFALPHVLVLVLGLALMWSRRRAHEWSGQLTRRRAVLCLVLLLLSLGLLTTQRPNPFLYFQF